MNSTFLPPTLEQLTALDKAKKKSDLTLERIKSPFSRHYKERELNRFDASRIKAGRPNIFITLSTPTPTIYEMHNYDRYRQVVKLHREAMLLIKRLVKEFLPDTYKLDYENWPYFEIFMEHYKTTKKKHRKKNQKRTDKVESKKSKAKNVNGDYLFGLVAPHVHILINCPRFLFLILTNPVLITYIESEWQRVMNSNDDSLCDIKSINQTDADIKRVAMYVTKQSSDGLSSNNIQNDLYAADRLRNKYYMIYGIDLNYSSISSTNWHVTRDNFRTALKFYDNQLERKRSHEERLASVLAVENGHGTSQHSLAQYR